MSTPEDVNKNNLENKEIPKVNPENLEQKEVSKEELLTYLDEEGKSFKNETSEEINKSNSIDLDQSTFEKIKNETGVEKELETINQEAENVISESKNELANENAETTPPELQQELNKLKFLQEERIRLQNRYDELEKEYNENFQLVSKKELSWYESEMSSIHNKLDNMRYSIPELEKKIETFKNPVIESKEQKENIEQNERIAEESKNEFIPEDKNSHKFRDFLTSKGHDVISVENENSDDTKQNSEIETADQKSNSEKQNAENSVSTFPNKEEVDKIFKENYLKFLTQDFSSEKSMAEKFNLLQNKLEGLDNENRLHGISARQLVEISKSVIRGERNLKDISDYSFSIDQNQIPLTLTDIVRNLLTEKAFMMTNIDSFRKIMNTFDFDVEEMNMANEKLDLIKSGKYVDPTDLRDSKLFEFVKKANEIMGLKKPEKRNTDSQWTDLNNPPTRWDKNAKPGDKIRP